MSASEPLHPQAGVCIDAVAIVPIASQPERAATVLPSWAAPAIVGRSQNWSENRERWAVQIAAGDQTGMWGPCSTATTVIIRDQFAALLIGKPVEAWRWFESLTGQGRLRAGAHYRHARSAVELALWDLRSRFCGRAVTDLLGGALRGTVPAYASALGVDIDHPLAVDIARWLAEAGFWGQKWALPGARRGERVVGAVGPGVELPGQLPGKLYERGGVTVVLTAPTALRRGRRDGPVRLDRLLFVAHASALPSPRRASVATVRRTCSAAGGSTGVSPPSTGAGGSGMQAMAT